MSDDAGTVRYAYDELYRLIAASYTGAITATYAYAYDEVGNMTAYTETVGAETTRVTRSFDDANRLQTSFDDDEGTTSYTYDANGNLAQILPPGVNPGDAGEQLYTYNQRNLLVENTVGAGGSVYDTVATYAYDGAGNRVQQVDYSGSQPVTTTYTNDNTGLSQVLVAGDGATQTHNVFGLDLIGQDEGGQTRYLLADGLGSVRAEMAGGEVEAATTYSPYGAVLDQTGTGGSTYGFTGEQQDGSTGLLYLRARYYNPSLRSFMGRDPWSGNNLRPQSMNGWSYVENNPVNLTDPTGMFPDWCKTATTDWWYADCVRLSYLLDDPWPPFGIWPTKLDQHEYNGPFNPPGILGSPGCYYGAVPYRAPGYLEGSELIIYYGRFGSETVYDFATFERRGFEYAGAGMSLTSLGAEWAASQSVGIPNGFRSWNNIEDDYSGTFIVGSASTGLDTPGFVSLGLSTGVNVFRGAPDFTVGGASWFVSLGVGLDLNPLPINLDFTGSVLYYWPNSNNRAYRDYIVNGVLMKDRFVSDILSGDESVFFTDHLTLGIDFGRRFNVQAHLARSIMSVMARHYANIYIDMHSSRRGVGGNSPTNNYE